MVQPFGPTGKWSVGLGVVLRAQIWTVHPGVA